MRKRYYILFIFTALVFGCKKNAVNLKTQPGKNDSLSFYFERSYNDSISISEKKGFTEKALAIISKQSNDSMNRINYFKAANRYYYLWDLENYKKTAQKVIKLSESSNDSASLAKAYSYLGDYYYNVHILDSSYLYYFKAEKSYRKLKNNSKAAQNSLNKIWLLVDQKDFVGSEKSLYDLLQFLKESKDYALISEAYCLLGVSYGELGQFEKALEFYHKYLVLAKQHKISNHQNRMSGCLNNMGLLYQNVGNHSLAIKYFKSSLAQLPPNYKDQRYASISDNLAYSKLKTGHFDEASELFFESLKIADSLKNFTGIINCKSNISELYFAEKDTLNAIKSAKDSYKISKENHYLRNSLQPLKLLINFDSKNASKYLLEYTKINDSLQLAERKTRNKFAAIEFETDELQQQKATLISRQSRIIYAGSGVLLLVSVLIVFGYYIQKNRELVLKDQQQSANEEIYRLMMEQQQKVVKGKQLEKKRISQELHDGIMGKLTSIRLNLFVLSKKTDDETIDKCLVHISEIQAVEKEIRTIAYDLQKNVFSDTLNFTTIVENLFAGIKNHSDIRFSLYADERIDWDIIGSEIKIHIYRVLQEGLQNIDKYANATKVAIRMDKAGDSIAIEMNDDGVGFDQNKVRSGLGLKNMKERIAEIGGSIRILSRPGGGTVIRLVISA